MAESSFSLDEFMCSVCLDLLKDPVTLHCGHNYCMRCITDCWNQDDLMGIYSCPQCRQTFSPRPALAKNTMLAEVIEKLKKTKVKSDVPACYAGAGDVKCDVCTGRKHKAIKSCLLCLNSYCQIHLEQHEHLFRGKHNLIDATARLQEMICSQHVTLLEIYCRTDHKLICNLCTMDEHKNHNTVSAVAERRDKERQLKETQRKFQERIQQREKDLHQLRDAVEFHKRSAQTAVEECEMMFTELISSIERRRSEVTQLIRDQEKTAVTSAEGLLERLKQEIDDLRRRDAELEKLLHTHDLLQRFQSLSVPPGSTDSLSNITVTSLLSFHHVIKSVSHLRDKLEHFCTQKIEKMSDEAVKHTEIIVSPELKIRDLFLQYSHQLTLDLNTINNHMHLSDGNRKITRTRTSQRYSAHPDRFDDVYQVLGRESVCGRSYWEMNWSDGGFGGVDISVSYKSIRRKGRALECWFGYNDQSWSLFCCDSSYTFRHDNKHTDLSVEKRCNRIGVYVDHSAGILSFYSVSNTIMTLIHTIQTTFTQPLYPAFTVGLDSTVKLCDLSI